MIQINQHDINHIVGWIKEWFNLNGKNASAVIGISGGKDSTIVAALLVRALGKERVVGVLMPNGEQTDIADAKKVVNILGIKSYVINIKDMVDAEINQLNKAGITPSTDTLINIPPRIRMTTLYAIAQSLPNGGRVVNTCNRSEDYVGYSTKYGDAAGDFSPCANITVTEMLQIGDLLNLPYELVHKTPSDDLCGQNDEDKLGFTYAVLDQYILTGICNDPNMKKRIDMLHTQNLHKMRLMPSYPHH